MSPAGQNRWKGWDSSSTDPRFSRPQVFGQSKAAGSEEQMLVFRRVRDEISRVFGAYAAGGLDAR